MSLETNPSIRSEWKLRLEIFLSTCWRLYSAIEKYFYRRRKWGATDSKLIELAAESAEYYLRYRGDLEIKHLENAVSKFWKAKNYETPRIKQYGSLYYLYIEGFADKTSKRRLVSSFRSMTEGLDAKLVTQRYKFRPDVAYLIAGNYGLWSGFSLQLQSSDISVIRRAGEVVKQLNIRRAGDVVEQLNSRSEIVVERFNVTDCNTRGVHAIVMRNITELLPLIEDLCDRELAASICSEMLRIDIAPELQCTEQELAKLFMLAGKPFPGVLNSKGWMRLSIRYPDWRALKQVNADDGVKMNDLPAALPTISITPKPTPSTAVIQDALLFSGDVLVVGKDLISIDPAANPAFSFVAEHQGVVVGTPAILGTAAVRMPRDTSLFIPEGILLSSRADKNWFHWLIETLPKILYLDSEVPAEIPIIISDTIPKSAKESISHISKRRVIEITHTNGARIGKLYVASPVLFHPDPIELYLSPVTNSVNIEALTRLRRAFLHDLTLEVGKPSRPESIYVGRIGTGRSLINSRKVAGVLRELGFEDFSPGGLSIMEQVVAFNSAKRIVLVGGASMANLIFCGIGTEIWTINSPLTSDYMMPKILASLSGSRVTPIVGRAVGNFMRNSKTHKLHAHIKISHFKIVSALAPFLGRESSNTKKTVST